MEKKSIYESVSIPFKSGKYSNNWEDTELHDWILGLNPF